MRWSAPPEIRAFPPSFSLFSFGLNVRSSRPFAIDMVSLQCPLCRGDCNPDVVAEIAGRQGPARIRITDLPIRRCTYCEKASLKYNDFLPDFLDVMRSLNTLPTAKPVGLFKKQPGCVNCRKLLGGGETGPVTYTATLDLTDPPFKTDLSLYATTCSHCGERQVIPEGAPIEADIAAAFKRACESRAVHVPEGTLAD